MSDPRHAAELAHLCELTETVQEVLWVANATNTEWLYISPAYESVFGRDRAALRDDPHDWVNALHEEDRERMRSLAVSPSPEIRHERFRIVRPGGAIRTVEIKVFPIREHDQVVRFAGVATDITERLQLEAQIRETQKLESLGLLAGGIAHDFNNILAIVAANAGFLRRQAPDEPFEPEVIDEIERAVERGTALTRQLLMFSRKQVVMPTVLDLNTAIADTTKMLRRMVGEDVVLETQLASELPSVRIDPGALVQVLMNLAVNARDAMPRGGRLTISTRGLGSEVLIAMADTGCGMSAAVRARVFEPLFTTKEIGRGTGLGLSVVHGIVRQAGGRIEVDSELGVGTTLRIYLPACQAPSAKRATATTAGHAGSEKLIVVEDDPHVRASLSRTLRNRGYEVFEAASGAAALTLLGEHGRGIDLLVTDVVMPGMDGRELVESARRMRPTLRALYISGYTDDAIVHHGIEDPASDVLEKPFPGDALAARVRKILDDAKLRGRAA